MASLSEIVQLSLVDTSRQPTRARQTSWTTFGANLVPATDDVTSRIRQHCPVGVDVSFEAPGADTSAVQALIGALGRNGRAITVSRGRPAEIDLNNLMLAEIECPGRFAYHGPDSQLSSRRSRTAGSAPKG